MNSWYFVKKKLPLLILFFSCGLLANNETIDSVIEPPKLKRGYGFLIIDTQAGRKVSEWKLSKKMSISQIPTGHNVRIIPLEAGNYHWQSVSVPEFDLPYRLNLSKNKRWSFTVQKNKLNYIGRLMVEQKRSTDSVNVRLVNRATMTYHYIEEKFPEYLKHFDFIYSGQLPDHFPSLFPPLVETQ